MQETGIWHLGQEDPLKKEMATHSSFPRKFLGQRRLAGYSPWDHKRVGNNWATKRTKQKPQNKSVFTMLSFLFAGHSEVLFLTPPIASAGLSALAPPVHPPPKELADNWPNLSSPSFCIADEQNGFYIFFFNAQSRGEEAKEEHFVTHKNYTKFQFQCP